MSTKRAATQSTLPTDADGVQHAFREAVLHSRPTYACVLVKHGHRQHKLDWNGAMAGVSCTPLQFVLRPDNLMCTGTCRVARCLLETKAQVDTQCPAVKGTALSWLCADSSHNKTVLKAAELLLEAKADPSGALQHSGSLPPLVRAVMQANVPLVAMLLHAKADVHRRVTSGAMAAFGPPAGLTALHSVASLPLLHATRAGHLRSLMSTQRGGELLDALGGERFEKLVERNVWPGKSAAEPVEACFHAVEELFRLLLDAGAAGIFPDDDREHQPLMLLRQWPDLQGRLATLMCEVCGYKATTYCPATQVPLCVPCRKARFRQRASAAAKD